MSKIISHLDTSSRKFYESTYLNEQTNEEVRLLLEVQRKDTVCFNKNLNLIIIRNITNIINNEKIKNQSKYLELLAGTVSHEMMTPLNSITTLSKLTIDILESKKNASGEILNIIQYMNIIYKSSKMLYFLTKDLLDLLKIQRGTFKAKMAFDLNPVQASEEVLDYFDN